MTTTHPSRAIREAFLAGYRPRCQLTPEHKAGKFVETNRLSACATSASAGRVVPSRGVVPRGMSAPPTMRQPRTRLSKAPCGDLRIDESSQTRCQSIALKKPALQPRLAMWLLRGIVTNERAAAGKQTRARDSVRMGSARFCRCLGSVYRLGSHRPEGGLLLLACKSHLEPASSCGCSQARTLVTETRP